MITVALIIVYIVLWIISTLCLFIELYDNTFKGTKQDVIITLIIPFYTSLKEAINNYKNL
jgi:hypothetical protein